MALELEVLLVQTTGINTVIAMAIRIIMAMAMVMVVMQIQKAKSSISIKKPPNWVVFLYAIFSRKRCELKLSNSLPLYPLFF